MVVRTVQFWRSANDVLTCFGSGFPLILITSVPMHTPGLYHEDEVGDLVSMSMGWGIGLCSENKRWRRRALMVRYARTKKLHGRENTAEGKQKAKGAGGAAPSSALVEFRLQGDVGTFGEDDALGLGEREVGGGGVGEAAGFWGRASTDVDGVGVGVGDDEPVVGGVEGEVALTDAAGGGVSSSDELEVHIDVEGGDEVVEAAGHVGVLPVLVQANVARCGRLAPFGPFASGVQPSAPRRMPWPQHGGAGRTSAIGPWRVVSLRAFLSQAEGTSEGGLELIDNVGDLPDKVKAGGRGSRSRARRPIAAGQPG